MSQPYALLTVGDEIQFEKELRGPLLHGIRDPRFAMIGRSNVGKSSLINALLGKRLAQTSAEPGKTRKLHFYHWKELGWVLADFPGYGYARAAKSSRDDWGSLIQSYLRADSGLQLGLVLLDARHGPTEQDLEAIEYLARSGLGLIFIMTKSDQIRTQSDRSKRQKEVAAALGTWASKGEVPLEQALFWTSVEDSRSIHRLKLRLADIRKGVVL